MQPYTDAAALSPWQPGILSLVIYIFVVLGLVAVLMLLTAWIGARQPGTEKLRAYESGIIPTGTARLRYPVPFFLVAIFFLIFDVEGAFIFSWAVASNELGWLGWFKITFFITMLLIGLVYIWRKGGLEWGPTLRKK